MPPASSLPVMLPAPPSLPPLPQERSGAMLAPPSDPLLVPAGSPGQDFGPPPPISTSAPEPAILSPSPRTVAAPPLSPPPATAPAPAVASDPAPPTGSAMPLPPLPGDGAGTPNPTAIQSRVDSGQLLGLTVATVGTEVVSLVELQDAVREWQRVNVPKGQALTREQVNQIASGMLEQLIDRAIFIEEAKRVLLKSEKQRKAFDEFINKQWKEKEIPILVRRYDLKNETALRDHLERQGRSLELLLERYRKETMAREFLHNQLAQRLVKPEVRELWSYYRDHPAEFQRGAKVTWRELTIKSGPTLDRAAARAPGAELMEQIARGADFATVAKARSHGSTAPKGGLWETSPGASASPAVNQALDALPIGQLSGLLEAPDGFHVVRVEDRRAAGPADFSEVQEEIRSKIQAELFQREAEAFTKRLREQTLITYHIKNPRESKRDGQAERAAAGPPSSSSSSSPGP
jgi:parvulin-like peptidyl-prolyl isomerase